MKSIDIVQFRCDLENYIRQAELPAEVKRMVLSYICRKASEEASQEIAKQIEEREKENVSEESDS